MKQFILLSLTLTLLALPGCKSVTLPYGQVLKLTELLGEAVPDTAGITIKFDQEPKRFAGNAGCNNYSGAYTIDGSKLKFGPAMATKKMCADMSIMNLENKFLPMLDQVASFTTGPDDTMSLSDAAGTVLARFRK